MIYTIQNECLKVAIEEKGAELWSIQDMNGQEYLWQGDATYWGGRSTMLFPYVGRLTQGKYVYDKKEYEMTNHGFAKLFVFSVAEQSADSITFSLKDSAETKGIYPFAFVLYITYSVKGNQLSVAYRVENKDDTTMYFGIGGHPGFNVPMDEGLEFSDYSLVFGEKVAAYQVGMSEDCYVNGKDKPFSLEDGVRLPMEHNMFDDDAIILRDMAKSVTLCAEKGKKAIQITYADMDYLGIWHKPKTDAPYVCIEPWASIPSRKDVIEDLATQENLIALSAGGVYENGWQFALVEVNK